jgi:hypothetical protein
VCVWLLLPLVPIIQTIAASLYSYALWHFLQSGSVPSLLSIRWLARRDGERDASQATSTEPAYLPIPSLIHPQVPDNPTQGHVSAYRDSNPSIRVERHGSMAEASFPQSLRCFSTSCASLGILSPQPLAPCKIDDESSQ